MSLDLQAIVDALDLRWLPAAALILGVAIGFGIARKAGSNGRGVPVDRPERQLLYWTAAIALTIAIIFAIWTLDDAKGRLQGIGSFFQGTLGVAVSFAGAVVAIRLAQLGLHLVRLESAREQLKHAEDILRDAASPFQALAKSVSRYFLACRSVGRSLTFLDHFDAKFPDTDFSERLSVMKSEFDAVSRRRAELALSLDAVLSNSASHFVWEACLRRRIDNGTAAIHWGGEYTLESVAVLLEKLEILFDYSWEPMFDELREHWRGLRDGTAEYSHGSFVWAGAFVAEPWDGAQFINAMKLAIIVDTIPGEDDLAEIVVKHLNLIGGANSSPDALKSIEFFSQAISPRSMISKALRQHASSVIASPTFGGVSSVRRDKVDEIYARAGKENSKTVL